MTRSASQSARLAELTKKPLAAQDAGRLDEAEASWRNLVRRFPDEAQLHFHLADVLQRQGRLESAAASYLRVAQLEPRAVAAHVNLANVLEKLDRLPEAEARCRTAIRLEPDFAVAHYNLGRLLQRQGRGPEAAAAYRTAVRLQPNLARAHHNLGNVLRGQGMPADAVVAYQRALAIDGSVPSVHADLGDALQELGQFADAEESYRHALALKPDEPSTLYALGTALQAQGRIDEAIESYEQALRRNPGYAEATVSLGGALHQRGDVDAALACYRRALAESPELAHARLGVCIAQLPVIYESEAEIAERRERYRAELEALARHFDRLDDAQCRLAADAVGALQPFYLPYQGGDDRALQRTYGGMICRLMSRRYPQWSARLPMPEATSEGRLRIGFVSGFFRNHAGWSMQQGWAEAFDRSRFELYGYHTSAATDERSPLIRRTFDRFVQGPLELEHWAALIRGQGLHALIFPELGMDPMTARLGALRLAPIQMTSWGHPVTSGLPTIDYFLSSEMMEPPEGDDYYDERLVRLPNLGIHYRPPGVVPEAVEREELGIDRDALAYCCCQSTYKYLPQHDDVFPRIAQAVPNACFVFVVQQGGAVERVFRRRLAAAFARHDLDAQEFCRFLPALSAERFLGITALSDVFLDSLDWSGCNTSLGAIALGKPIVTLSGRFMRGRHTAAMLRMMGLDDLIVGTVDEYVRFAAWLGSDAALRAQVSARVKAGAPRLLRDKAPVRALEDFIEHAVAACRSRVVPMSEASSEAARAPNDSLPDAGDPNGHWQLARARQAEGRLAEAAAAFRQGIALRNLRYAEATRRPGPLAAPASAASVTDRTVEVCGLRYPAIAPVPEGAARPFWSVVIPAYQRTRYLLECLASVLAQWPGERDMEIVVVDNGSDPPLAELVQSLGQGIVRYHRHARTIALQRNWNSAVAASRGRWVHLLNDDDYVLPGFYASLQAGLERCPDSVGAAFTGYENVDEHDQVNFRRQVYGEQRGVPRDWLSVIGVANPLNPPAVVVRRAAYERLGGYSTDILEPTDWDLYKRIASVDDWWCEPGLLARYRVHPGNVTAEQTRAGAQGREIRVAIEMAERYLPAERCAELTAKARRAAFERCLEHLRLPLLAGNTAGAMRLLGEMLRIDRTAPSLEALFAWLATAMAEPLWRPIAELCRSAPEAARAVASGDLARLFDRLQTRTAEAARRAMAAQLLAAADAADAQQIRGTPP